MNRKKIYFGIVGAAIAVVIVAFLTYSTENMEKNANKENAMQSSNNSLSLKLIQTIQLPNVSGRIDHMDIDLDGKRLFVSELGNDSVDVIDLTTEKRIKSVTGLHGPQGVVFVPDVNKIFVANGQDGTVQIFDSNTYSLLKTISLGGDADNMHYDPYQKLVYVGYGSGGLAVIDPTKLELIDTIKLDGHPESFQISDKMQPGIFVNVPEDNSIAVIDAQKRALVTKWQNSEASGNYPMALDEGNHRLFTVYRSPSQLQVVNTDTGKPVAKLDIVKDADDTFFDDKNGQIYITGGEGYVDVISQKDANNYQEMAKIPTSDGGRTSLFVPQLDKLFIAIPDYLGSNAKLLVFETHKVQ